MTGTGVVAPRGEGIAGAADGAGVIMVHGFPAMQMIYSGATALLIATV